MRRLMLLRHAKSDWSEAGARDQDRPLNRRGREAVPKIAAYIARNALIPDHVLCSTAKRARETLELLAAGLPQKPAAEFSERLYAAEPDAILELVRTTPRAIHSLLVIGHNPGLQQAALLLIASGDVDTRERLHEKLPTAALVVIDIAADDWRKVHPHGGRLDRFITPELLAVETD